MTATFRQSLAKNVAHPPMLASPDHSFSKLVLFSTARMLIPPFFHHKEWNSNQKKSGRSSKRTMMRYQTHRHSYAMITTPLRAFVPIRYCFYLDRV